MNAVIVVLLTALFIVAVVSYAYRRQRKPGAPSLKGDAGDGMLDSVFFEGSTDSSGSHGSHGHGSHHHSHHDSSHGPVDSGHSHGGGFDGGHGGFDGGAHH